MAQAQVFQPVDQAIGVVQGVFTPARSTYWKMKRSWRLSSQSSSAWRRRARFQARLTGIVALRAASVVALTETASCGRGTIRASRSIPETRPAVLTVMRHGERPAPSG